MFFGRGISAFFNQFFKWLFWNKKGQKLLFSILFVFIFFCFIKLGEVSAVEEVQDVNYKAYTYYDGVVNEAILRLSDNWDNISQSVKDILLSDNRWFYFYYGSADGSSYNNAKPTNNGTLYIMYIGKGNISNATATANDYLGITGITMYQRNYTGAFQVSTSNNVTDLGNATRYLPYEFVQTYTNSNWVTFINSIKFGDTATLVQLLEDIKSEQQKTNEALTNTEPTSETDSFIDVDSSSVDDLSSASVDNVFSNMTTSFSNKFTNYDLNTINSFVWDFKRNQNNFLF